MTLRSIFLSLLLIPFSFNSAEAGISDFFDRMVWETTTTDSTVNDLGQRVTSHKIFAGSSSDTLLEETVTTSYKNSSGKPTVHIQRYNGKSKLIGELTMVFRSAKEIINLRNVNEKDGTITVYSQPYTDLTTLLALSSIGAGALAAVQILNKNHSIKTAIALATSAFFAFITTRRIQKYFHSDTPYLELKPEGIYVCSSKKLIPWKSIVDIDKHFVNNTIAAITINYYNDTNEIKSLRINSFLLPISANDFGILLNEKDPSIPFYL